MRAITLRILLPLNQISAEDMKDQIQDDLADVDIIGRVEIVSDVQVDAERCKNCDLEKFPPSDNPLQQICAGCGEPL